MQLKLRVFGGVTAAVLGGASLLFAGGAAGAGAVSARAVSQAASARMHLAPGHLAGTTLPYKQVNSTNWSGYAQAKDPAGTFSAVESTWIVPTVKTGIAGKQYASDWVGIGGFSEDTLVQAGTGEWNANGTAKYNAWTEILPAAEVPISGLTISPGDKIKTIVEETSTKVWKMTVKDLTTGQSGGKTVSYKSSGESAEAIHERPEVGTGLATLAKTNNVTFEPAFYSTSGPGTPVWTPLLGTAPSGKLYEIFMVNNDDSATIASPSAPSSDHEGFAVAYGATSPPPPS